MKLFTLIILALSSFSAFSNASLVDAIEYGSLKSVKSLLDSGVDPNSIDEGYGAGKSKPVIFYAIENERIDVLKLLLSYGADVNVEKTGDGVINNSLLMVAVRKLALRESKGKMSSIISLLLDGEFELETKRYTFELNPYTLGGGTGRRDVISVILSTGFDLSILTMIYSHKNIDPLKFQHRDGFLRRAIRIGKVEALNLYLEYNAPRVTKKAAKKALETLNLKYTTDFTLISTELNQRLREIAF
jgi:hypothetical protein